LILISGIEWQDEGRGRVSRMQKGGNEEKQEKDVRHNAMIWSIGWEGSVLGKRDGRGWAKVRGCGGGWGGGKVCVWISRL
jgi:hypothetical protein